VSTSAQAADPKNKVKIGALMSISGPLAFMGTPQERVIRMHVDALNKNGGLNGHPVELIIYDTEGNSTKAVQQLRRLIDSDKVDVILGPSSSGEALVALPIVNEGKVPMIAFASSAKVTNPVTPYAFSTSPSDQIAIPAFLSMLQKRQVKKIALMSSTDGFGQSGSALVKSLASQYGMSLTTTEEFNRQDTDITAQLLRVRQSGADALVVWGMPPAVAVLMRNAKAIGYDKPIFNSYGAASHEVLAQSGPAAEGSFMISQRLTAPPADLLDSEPMKPVVQQVYNTYFSRFKESPSTFGGLAYDALLIIEKAAKSINGPITRQSLRDVIEKTEVLGTNGHFKFSPANHNGLDANSNSIVMLTAKNGQWTIAK
jgi:branched-chain amino acid transport system substrate-binding protein